MSIGVDHAIARARKLTKQELVILRASPYGSAGTQWGDTLPTRRLTKDGLLERNPTSPTCYRITEDGAEVLIAYFAMRKAKTLRLE